MSEHIVHSYEVEVEPGYKTIGFGDGGVSAIVVDCLGDTVRLFKDNHKYMRSPERSSDGRVYVKGHTAGGETVFLVIGCCNAVAFGKRADGGHCKGVNSAAGVLECSAEGPNDWRRERGVPWAYYRCCWCSI